MNKITKIVLILVVFTVSMSIRITNPAITRAVLTITEVYPNPKTDEKEWVELFNDTQDTIELLGWKLMDKLSSPSVIFQFDQQNIEAESYLVVELTTNKLNNPADAVELINNNDEIINQFSYTDSQLGLSFSLMQDSDQRNLQIILAKPTKGVKNFENSSRGDNDSESSKENNLEDVKKESFPELVIAEVMACPESDSPEWIKIHNPNSDSVALNNWQAKDAANNLITLPASEIIPGQGSTTIFLIRSILNNSGDVVFLFDPNDRLIDQFSYGECIVGTSLTTETTPSSSLNSSSSNSSNNFSDSPENSSVLNSPAKNNDLGTQDENKPKISNKAFNLKRIASILKITNTDKSSSENNQGYQSKQVVVKHEDIPKTAIISVIIGGAILVTSGLFFK